MRGRFTRLTTVSLIVITIGLVSLQLGLAKSRAPSSAASPGSSTRGVIGGQASPAAAAAVAAGANAGGPGGRPGAVAAGSPLPGLTSGQMAYFLAGQEEFAAADSVTDGLGPRMNLDSCGGCHAFPAIGGTSPALNPQVAFASQNGALDHLPSF